MLIQDEIAQLINVALQAAQKAGDLPPFAPPQIVVERPKDLAHGDYASPSAMPMARLARMAPLKIAEQIVNHLPDADYIDSVAVAPPGYINVRLTESWLVEQVETILAKAADFGRLPAPPSKTGPKKVQVEFVSSNPTGPFVVGSGRNAVLGDTLANILAAAGYEVQREYYVNDIGAQVDHLGMALYARYAQALGEDVPTYEQYQGDYLVDIGREMAAEFGKLYLEPTTNDPANIGPQTLMVMRQEAVNRILESIKADTALIGVHFDNWFSEKSLYDHQTYQLVYDKLLSQDLLRERDGAVWLVDEDEADKENVIVRSDGRPTYFASDIAYVWDKLAKRKFDWAIYVWGADHHGHVTRLKEAGQLLGLDSDKITILLYQLVNLTRDGVPVRQSKRAGDFITVREVVEEIGVDAFRFMLLTRSADSAMELDLELAKRQSTDNPVYYIQYAHARIASIFRKAKEEGATMGGGDVNLLEHPSEIDLIRQMLRLPEVVQVAAEALAPHQLTYYAQELATSFHAFYRDCKVVIDDDELSAARLKLVRAAQITLANTLRLMGMSVPDRM